MSKTLAQIQHWSGVNSRDHGFHDDWPEWDSKDYERQLSLAITEKLALIHEEISEALGEIRSGHDPLLTYYRDKATNTTHGVQKYDTDGLGEIPMRKPEGFMIELADAVIRIADLAFLVGGDLDAAVAEKHEYNRTRPYKHGRKF